MEAERKARGWTVALAWSLLTFVLCVCASAICGRSIWCDEILRINGQHYPLADLFAYKHLQSFCTQTPTAYLFMRPFQLLLGYEAGGSIASALSGAVITLAVLRTLARLDGGRRPGVLASLIVSMNPLLIYYCSEICFYGMWAAAFACAFSLLAGWWDGQSARKTRTRAKMSERPAPGARGGGESALPRDPRRNRAGGAIGGVRAAILIAISGSLFVTFHYAGLPIWGVVAAVAALIDWKRRGFFKAATFGAILAIPAILNLRMYIDSSDKAVHVGAQAFSWSNAGQTASELMHYIYSLSPSLTGGSLVGVLLFAIGAVLLFRDSKLRWFAALALASIFAVALFLVYSGMRGYMPNVARYWVYALAPALAVVGFATERIMRGSRKWLRVIPGLAIAGNALAVVALIQLDGRLEPYKKLVSSLEGLAPRTFTQLMPRYVSHGHGSMVICANSYSARFLGGYYKLPDGMEIAAPCYWEQGGDVIRAGLREMRKLSPLAPVYFESAEQRDYVLGTGEDASLDKNIIVAQPSECFRIAASLGLMPEPSIAKRYPASLVLPSMGDYGKYIEENGLARAIPLGGFRVGQFGSRAPTEPRMTVLVTTPGKRASIGTYVSRKSPPLAYDPATGAVSGILVLDLLAQKPAAISIGRNGEVLRTVRLTQGAQRITVPVSGLEPSKWQGLSMTSDGEVAIFGMELRWLAEK